MSSFSPGIGGASGGASGGVSDGSRALPNNIPNSTAAMPRRAPTAPADGPVARVGHSTSNGRVLLGLLVGTALALLLCALGLTLEMSAAFGFLAGSIAWIADGWRTVNRTVALERQLAEVLDLLGSSVAAGVSLVAALDGVVQDTSPPLRGVLFRAAERLRLGDDPLRVFAEAERALPLPAFRLLTQYLSVQWQSGGNIAAGVHSIAETIRSRVDLSRRVHSQTAEVRFSVLGILGVVYLIAWIAWSNNPVRVEAFVQSPAGSPLIAACIFAQGLGLIWIARMSRIEV